MTLLEDFWWGDALDFSKYPHSERHELWVYLDKLIKEEPMYAMGSMVYVYWSELNVLGAQND